MTQDLVLSTTTGAVRILTLNRPVALNSFTGAMHEQLLAALNAAADDAAVRAVIVTGAGRGFCAGQDLNDPDMSRRDGSAPDVGAVIERRYVPLALRIRSMPVPVIAAINGVAAGAGANFALGCDMVVAARSAGFIQAFSKIGLIPDCGGTWLLTRLVGRARALGLAMTGDKLPAEEAQRIGLIWQCVDDTALMDSAMALASTTGGDAEHGAGRDAAGAGCRGDARLRRCAGAGGSFAARAGPCARLLPKAWRPSWPSARRSSPTADAPPRWTANMPPTG